MTFKQFDELTQDIMSQVIKMRDTKGKEYANNDVDRLANFKEIAQEVGTSTLVVWSTYFKKHTRAIDSFIKRGSGQVLSESIESRFVDAITYLLLGYAIIVDEHEKREDPFLDMCVCGHGRPSHGSGITRNCFADGCPCDKFRPYDVSNRICTCGHGKSAHTFVRIGDKVKGTCSARPCPCESYTNKNDILGLGEKK